MKSVQSHLLTSVNLIGTIKINSFTFGYPYDISTSKTDHTQEDHKFSLKWQIERESHSYNNYLVKDLGAGIIKMLNDISHAATR